jgi:phytoene/squalene synthetase
VSPAPAPAVAHYENFPVASVLCPPHLRAPIRALYLYARTADDIADEGDAPAAQRLAELAAYREELAACYAAPDRPPARWPDIFGPLRRSIHDFQLPQAPLADLLSAFVQDVETTQAASGPGAQPDTPQSTTPVAAPNAIADTLAGSTAVSAPRAAYADRAELLDYCRRSANPVGRLLLHLHGLHDAQALAQSDAICSALQLINFWQDLSRDIPRGRHYLCAADRAAHSVSDADLQALRPTPEALSLIASVCAWARALMLEGAPLVHQIPGRMAWELRLVVQGGLRILDKIEALGFNSLQHRPKITAADGPLLLWRAFRMRAPVR